MTPLNTPSIDSPKLIFVQFIFVQNHYVLGTEEAYKALNTIRHFRCRLLGARTPLILGSSYELYDRLKDRWVEVYFTHLGKIDLIKVAASLLATVCN